MTTATTTTDAPEAGQRMAMRPVMHQTWDRLLFLHWRVPAAVLEPRLPSGVTLDTFDGSAWIAITPFTMYGIRLTGLPAIPTLDRAHEVNVRTYVSRDGEAGVWFFSLDIDHAGVAAIARMAYHLPYYAARIRFDHPDPAAREQFHARRLRRHGMDTSLEVRWETSGPAAIARPASLEHFLVERYCLYAARGDRLYRARIEHAPWALRNARVSTLTSTMLEANGFAAPASDLVAFAQAGPLDVRIGAPRRLR